jgi:hypothetical protein
VHRGPIVVASTRLQDLCRAAMPSRPTLRTKIGVNRRPQNWVRKPQRI